MGITQSFVEKMVPLVLMPMNVKPMPALFAVHVAVQTAAYRSLAQSPILLIILGNLIL